MAFSHLCIRRADLGSSKERRASNRQHRPARFFGREAIASNFKRDRFNGGIHHRLNAKHGLGYDEADEVIRYVCDPANPSRT
jgi:hypothetical protein